MNILKDLKKSDESFASSRIKMPEDQAEMGVHLSPQTQPEYIINGRIFTEPQVNTSREPWTMKGSRKIPALADRRRERRRKRNRKRIWLVPATLRGSEEKSGLQIQGRPSLGEPSRDRRGALFSVGWEHVNSLWQQERGRCVHRVLTRALPTQFERVSTTADKGWVLKCGVWRADQGRGLLWVVRRHPTGKSGSEELYKWGCCGGSLNHHTA